MPKPPEPQQLPTPLPATLFPGPQSGSSDASSRTISTPLTATQLSTSSPPSSANSRAWLPEIAVQWWPVWLGLALLFVPSINDLLRGPWSTEEQGHGTHHTWACTVAAVA